MKYILLNFHRFKYRGSAEFQLEKAMFLVFNVDIILIILYWSDLITYCRNLCASMHLWYCQTWIWSTPPPGVRIPEHDDSTSAVGVSVHISHLMCFYHHLMCFPAYLPKSQFWHSHRCARWMRVCFGKSFNTVKSLDDRCKGLHLPVL